MTVGLASAAGPTLGAAVLAVAPWPAVFVAHIPMGLAALVFGLKLLPRVPGRRRPFDLTAAGLNVAGFGLVFLGMDLLLHAPWVAVPALLGGALCAAALVRHEMARPVPLLPLDLLRIRVVRFAVSASVCMFAAHMLLVIGMPFHLSAAGYTPVQIGLIVTPYPLAVGLLGPIAGRWADRASSTFTCVLGGVFLAAALVILALVPPTTLWAVCGALLLAGIGFAGFQTPNNRAMLSAAPRARAGSAGGMQATARVLGQSTGAVTAAACFTLGGPWLGFLCGVAFALASSTLSLVRGAR